MYEPLTIHVRPQPAADLHVIDEVFKEQAYRWDPEAIKGGAVLDIGANIGAFSLWAFAVGAELTRAVEPEPFNYAQLVNNVRQNHATKVQCRNVAAAAMDGVTTITRTQRTADAWTGGDSGVQVEAQSLRTLMDGMGDTVWVKCDIEGAEYDLIEGADEQTLRRIVALAMEFHWTGPGALGVRPTAPATGSLGRIVERLAVHHKVYVSGHPHIGGLLWAKRT